MQFVLYLRMRLLFYIKGETLKTMSVYFIFNYVCGVIYRIGQVIFKDGIEGKNRKRPL